MFGKDFKKYPGGGALEGNSHAEGGIPIEAEGGEIMINTSMNEAADKHKAGLLALNENPDDYMIVEKDMFMARDGGLIPTIDARDRSDIV
jgi:hypothetical protein